jgi:hypothetical protein
LSHGESIIELVQLSREQNYMFSKAYGWRNFYMTGEDFMLNLEAVKISKNTGPRKLDIA